MKTVYAPGRSKNSLSAIAVLLFFFLCAPAAFAEAGLTKIADNVYSSVDIKNAAPQNSFGANAGIVIGRDGIVAYLPDKKILFAGDLLFTNYHTNLVDADLGGWVRALDKIMAINATVIVPGHGPLSGNKDVQAMKDYLVGFDKKARELAAREKNAEAR